MIDIDSLTLGEVAKVESLSGLSISAIAEEDKPKGLALAALVFVFKRRENPEFTWNQAQAVTVTEANVLLGSGDDDEAGDADEAPEAAGDAHDGIEAAAGFPPQLADES